MSKAPDKQVTNGWDEWKNHVLAELTRFIDVAGTLATKDSVKGVETWCSSIDKKLEKLSNEYSGFKGKMEAKAGVYGLIGGLIPVCVAVGVGVVLHFIKGQ